MNVDNSICIGFEHSHGYWHHLMQKICGPGYEKVGRSYDLSLVRTT